MNLHRNLDECSNAWCIKNLKGKILFINSAYKKLITPMDIGGHSFFFPFKNEIMEHDKFVLYYGKEINAFGIMSSIDGKEKYPFHCKRIPLLKDQKVRAIVSHVKPLLSISNNFFSSNYDVGILTCQKPDNIFTDKEWEVIFLIMQGYSEKEISKKLFRTLRTIKFHKSSILMKSDCLSSYELRNFIKKQGWQFYIPSAFSKPCYIIEKNEIEFDTFFEKNVMVEADNLAQKARNMSRR